MIPSLPNATSMLTNLTDTPANAFGAFIGQFNILGFGSDPIAIAFSIIFAIAVTRKQIIERSYMDTTGVFLASYVTFFSVGWATSLPLLVTFIILGCIGIIIADITKVWR